MGDNQLYKFTFRHTSTSLTSSLPWACHRQTPSRMLALRLRMQPDGRYFQEPILGTRLLGNPPHYREQG
jgi:hypothetical protein